MIYSICETYILTENTHENTYQEEPKSKTKTNKYIFFLFRTSSV